MESFRTVRWFWIAVAISAQLVAAGHRHSYDLWLRVDPAQHRIEGRAVVNHPPSNRFYLHDQLEVRRVTCGGEEIAFERERDGQTLPYTLHGRAVVLKKQPAGEITVEYAGALPELENRVNGVSSRLVELASYICWYPAFRGVSPFDFRLEIDLPHGMSVTTNGRNLDSACGGDRDTSRWESIVPGSDVVVLASPLLKVSEAREGAMRVEMWHSALEPSAVQQKIDNLSAAMRELSAIYGEPAASGLLRFAYSPRGGWGYSRMPLFVVSESYAAELLRRQDGLARDFHGGVHELAHFWWMIADPATPDDWINEGLAEYSAFRVSATRFGHGFAEQLLTEYETHAAQAPKDLAIAETEGGSDARYVNRYEKTTLLLREAASRFGQKRLDLLLRSLLVRFKDSRKATTELFLDEAEKALGADARAFFADRLLAKGWRSDKSR